MWFLMMERLENNASSGSSGLFINVGDQGVNDRSIRTKETRSPDFAAAEIDAGRDFPAIQRHQR
jgi:hypothetical protein